MIRIIVATIAIFLLATSLARAEFVVHVYEEAGDTVVFGSGTLDLTGMALVDDPTFSSVVSPGQGIISGRTPGIGLSSLDGLDAYASLTSNGGAFSGGLVSITSETSGGSFGIFNDDVIVPKGYTSGDYFSGSFRFSGESLSNLSMSEYLGTYTWGLPQDTFTLIIGENPPITTVPPGLDPGDPYRLAFITKDKIFTATSPSISTYDALVTSQANTSAKLVALGTNWRVIGSTSSIDAKVHTDTDDSPAGANGVPIYRLDGMIIANDYDDLWDGSIQNPLYVAQDGSILDTCCGTWTGTRTDGTRIPGDELGATDLSVVDGAPNGTAANWIQTNPFGANSLQYLYAISDVLTVFDPTVQVGIDVKPGNESGCGGAVPVAILGSETLDVTQIDPTTLSYEGLDVRQQGNGSLMCRVTDVNRDGYYDFLCQYQDTTTDGMLTGELLDGTPFKGVDTICVVN